MNRGGEVREEQREKGGGGPSREPDAMQELIPGPQDHDLSRRQTLNPLSHPGAPGHSERLDRQGDGQGQTLFWNVWVPFSTSQTCSVNLHLHELFSIVWVHLQGYAALAWCRVLGFGFGGVAAVVLNCPTLVQSGQTIHMTTITV